MKYYELELNGRTVKFRLTSNDCMVIEKETGKSVIDYMQEMSMTAIIKLLKFMVRSSQPTFNEQDASNLFDELIDAGYTLKDIIDKVLLEAMIVSGFMTRKEKTGIMGENEETEETL